MIIIRLSGGLGNQLFQYAYSIFLSEKFNKNIIIDKGALIRSWHRKYELKYFALPNSIKVTNLCWLENKKKLLIGDYNDINNMEDDYVYCLNGFYQNSKYVKSIENSLDKYFSFKIDKINKDLILQGAKLEGRNSVAIHIRRGDYESVIDTNLIYGGICTKIYYERSIQYIESIVNDPYYIIFTDDPDWVRSNYDLKGTIISDKRYLYSFIDNNRTFRKIKLLSKCLYSDKTINDFYLMTKCRHFVIANSTYSWWASMLSKNKNKIVCMPKIWNRKEFEKSDMLKYDKCVQIDVNQ